MIDLYTRPDKAERKQQIRMLLTFNDREKSSCRVKLMQLEEEEKALRKELNELT